MPFDHRSSSGTTVCLSFFFSLLRLFFRHNMFTVLIFFSFILSSSAVQHSSSLLVHSTISSTHSRQLTLCMHLIHYFTAYTLHWMRVRDETVHIKCRWTEQLNDRLHHPHEAKTRYGFFFIFFFPLHLSSLSRILH